jgi:hypothetical protein
VLPPLAGLARTAAALLTSGFAFLAVTAGRGGSGWRLIALYAVLHLLARYVRTGRYLIGRQTTGSSGTLWTWLLLTPIEVLFTLLFFAPIRGIALFGLCRNRWEARRDDHDLSGFTMPSAEPGTVYYGGHLFEGNR